VHDAASAALLKAGVHLPKTHAGLVSAFGLTVVGGGRVEKAIGASLNRVQRMREIADYTGDGLAVADAQEAVKLARDFIKAIESLMT
jgi:uncharacterized protein (UPF0332 family)